MFKVEWVGEGWPPTPTNVRRGPWLGSLMLIDLIGSYYISLSFVRARLSNKTNQSYTMKTIADCTASTGITGSSRHMGKDLIKLSSQLGPTIPPTIYLEQRGALKQSPWWRAVAASR